MIEQNKSPHDLPKLTLENGNTVAFQLSSTNQVETLLIPAGLHPNFVKNIASGLRELKEEGVNEDNILTILKVNQAGVYLHNAIISKNFDAILKPMFIKDKSNQNSIKSPFIDIPSNINERNEELNEHGINLKAIDLEYPLEHLSKLVESNFLVLKAVDGNKLIVTDNSSNTEYTILLPQEYKGDKEKIFEGEYFEKNKNNLVKVYKDNIPLQVLGVKDEYALNENDRDKYLPIICDVDAHNFCVKTSGNQTARNTASEHERKILLEEVNEILSKTTFNDKYPNIEQTIHPHMGKITAQEVIAYYIIDKHCGRSSRLNAIFQHGATVSMDEYDVEKVRQVAPNNPFPAISDSTKVVAVLASNEDRVAVINGADILLTYDILKQNGYKMEEQYLWNEQTEDLLKSDANQIRERKHEIIKTLDNDSLKVDVSLASTSDAQIRLDLPPPSEKNENMLRLAFNRLSSKNICHEKNKDAKIIDEETRIALRNAFK